MRAQPVGTLLGAELPAHDHDSGGPELPEPSAQAVAAGRFPRVPVIYGANRDEGRTFAQGFTGFTREQYEGFVRSQFGARADAVLAQYPWDSYPSPYTAAYAIGDIWTDSGVIGRIGGCATQQDARTFAQHTRTYVYEFADRNAPGLNNDHPGYQWGAGHAMELAYMWPSFDNGTPLAAQFTPAQRELSDRDGPPLGHVHALRGAVRAVPRGLAGLLERPHPLAASRRPDDGDRRRRVRRRAQVRVLGYGRLTTIQVNAAARPSWPNVSAVPVFDGAEQLGDERGPDEGAEQHEQFLDHGVSVPCASLPPAGPAPPLAGVAFFRRTAALSGGNGLAR